MANTYTSAIPSLPVALSLQGEVTAPAIAQGQQLSIQDVLRADEQLDRRKRHRPECTSVEEVAEAEIRKAAILESHVANKYHEIPPWFEGAMIQLRADLRADLQADMRILYAIIDCDMKFCHNDIIDVIIF